MDNLQRKIGRKTELAHTRKHMQAKIKTASKEAELSGTLGEVNAHVTNPTCAAMNLRRNSDAGVDIGRYSFLSGSHHRSI